MYATHPYTDISYLNVIAATTGSNWSLENPERFRVIVDAMNEAVVGRCGDVARERYNAVNNWCSEFARWSLLNSGMNNVGYCAALGPRGTGCLSWPMLSDVRTTPQMVKLFFNLGGFTPDSSMTTSSVKPGDYLAMTGSSGRCGHSGIVLGYSADYRWIWTVEGNVGDCVVGQRRPFFVDGVLDPKIDGVGNIDILF
jgi:hypothetical protein